MTGPIDAATTLYTASMSEADMIKRFSDLEDKAGLGFVFHIRYAKGQRVVGLPDVLAIIGPVLGFFELKTTRDRVSDRQRAVLAALDGVRRVESGIVRPVPHDGEISLDEALRRLEAGGVDRDPMRRGGTA